MPKQVIPNRIFFHFQLRSDRSDAVCDHRTSSLTSFLKRYPAQIYFVAFLIPHRNNDHRIRMSRKTVGYFLTLHING